MHILVKANMIMDLLNISHVIAVISYRDSMANLSELKIFVGDEYEDKISLQALTFKNVDLSAPDNIFYVRSIEELRGLMHSTTLYKFIIRSYIVYSFSKKSTKRLYISSFGGNKINSSQVKNFLANSIIDTEDEKLLSHLIETISGYRNNYDVNTDSFILSDGTQTYCRIDRVDDDVIIDSVFLKGQDSRLSNKEIITMMRDHNKTPKGLILRDEFIALEPATIISVAYLLIKRKEALAT